MAGWALDHSHPLLADVVLGAEAVLGDAPSMAHARALVAVAHVDTIPHPGPGLVAEVFVAHRGRVSPDPLPVVNEASVKPPAGDPVVLLHLHVLNQEAGLLPRVHGGQVSLRGGRVKFYEGFWAILTPISMQASEATIQLASVTLHM